MPDTFTPRLNLTKPEVGASDETWGDKINANSDAIDTQVVRRSGDTMTGNLAMGNNKITGLAAATNAGDAPRFDQVLPQSGGNVSGFIRVPGGSESAPSLQFSNENNGIYWLPGTGPFFTAGGSIIARLTSGTSLSTVDSIVTRQAGDNRYMQQNWTLTAGTGLSGGGTGAANRTLTIALGQLAYSTANMTEPRVIVVDGTSSGTQARMGDAVFRSNFNIAGSGTSINPGAGMVGGGTLAADRTISMGTPSSITRTSTNSASGNTHTHNLPQADFRDMMANYLAFNSLGSLVFAAKKTGGSVSPGGTAAGSTLAPASDGNDLGTGSLTGTFLCLGDGTVNRGTLWLKTA